MRLQLTPRRLATFGQDFLAERLNRRLGATPWIASAHGVFEKDAIPDNASLVISHNPEDAGESQILASLPPGVRSVAHRHVQWSYLTPEQQENVRRSMRQASLCITPAAFLADESRLLFPHVPCEVAHIGRDPAIYRPSPAAERALFRGRLGVSPESFLVIHVGRLEDAKGRQILTAMAPLLPANVLLLVQFTANSEDDKQEGGFWPAAKEIQQANPAQVRLWPDSDPLTDRPVRYADLLLSASLKEVAPMVAVEALMSGVPVAATDSTPFYAELRALGAEDLNIISLPFAPRLAPLARHELTLTENEAASAAHLLSAAITKQMALQNTTPQERRAERSACIAQAGFTEDAMAATLDALYQVETLRR